MLSVFVRELSGRLSFCPREKAKYQCPGDCVKAQRIRTSFCLGFISALYWRQTFTKKGGGKVMRETNFLWQEYYLIFWPIEVFLVSTQIPCANCSTYILLYRYIVYSVPKWFRNYYIENKLVTVFLHKVGAFGIFTLSKMYLYIRNVTIPSVFLVWL